jgi:FlgD Ig-like domain
MRRIFPAVFAVLFLLVSANGSFGHKTASPEITPAPGTPPLGPVIDSSASRAPRNTASSVLQLWTFDDGSGNGDTQGWTSVDRTAQPAYFHVDDFAGMSPPYAALEGSHSLWCGARACQTTDLCSYATLPGYGNDWNQRFESVPFNVSGDVDVAFQMRYDTEPNYDVIYLEYESIEGVWHTAGSWSGSGNGLFYAPIPASAYLGPLSLRLRFESDFSYSDEDGLYPTDGAVVVDQIHVADTNGDISNENFESEAPGALTTTDQSWHALPPPPMGDYANLFWGSDVLQEDPNYTNETALWGFFDGSPDHYACGGHPETQVVPFGTTYDGIDTWVNDEIVSPTVSLTGVTGTESVVLSFDMYRDLPQDNLVFYRYSVRSLVSGAWTRWQFPDSVYDDPSKTWATFTRDIRPLIATGATDIQIAIGVRDYCSLWCGLYGSGACHSQGPLIDNVRLTHSNTASGSNVVVQPVDDTSGTTPITVTFSDVTAPGLTSLVTSSSGPPVPGSFMLGDGTYYDLSTTATTSGNITVCIAYDPNTLQVPENTLQMLHWDTTQNPAAWVDITTSLDTNNHVICGTTDHLSPFVMGVGSVTGVHETPMALALHQNVPNPFNPTTAITYDVPAGGASVTIRIYDATGRLVRTLVDGPNPAGTHSVSWDGRNSAGGAVSSGVYFYRMTAGSFTASRRMVLLK